jgi:hypothetical protein
MNGTGLVVEGKGDNTEYPVHSCLSAATGSRLEALIAGSIPKTIPAKAEQPSAATMARGGVAA